MPAEYMESGKRRLTVLSAATPLPQNVRDRLVLENDEVSWSVDDVLNIQPADWIPLVFDNLHHAVNNPDGMPAREALQGIHRHMANDQKPKIHFSSQRREERRLSRRDRATGHVQEVMAKAKPGQHDDWIDVTEFITLLDGANDLQFDVMLEAKQKQLALLRLREDLAAASRGELAW